MMNLKSTKFRGILSEAMILCGTNNSTDINQVKLQLLQPKLSIDTNTRVQLHSLPDLADPLAVIKKKNYEAEYASHFTTDSNCNGLFQNHQLVVLDPNDLSTPIPLIADGISNGIIH
jgi:tRNA-binding EMAP/Myf-like protein